MRVIITGGTGLIGRELSKELLDAGHGVIVLSRNPDAREKVSPELEMVEWDARSPSGWSDRLEEADGIVNLAGENIAGSGLIPDRWTRSKKDRILGSRLDAGRAVKEAIENVDEGPEVLVQASAVGYYGPRGNKVVTEGSKAGDGYLARTAEEWEKVTAPVEKSGVRRAVIRTGLVLSTEGGAFPRLTLPFKLMVGGPLGDGRQYYPWIHIRDEARAIRFLLENEGVSGPFNLTAPEPKTNREFAEKLSKVMGRPSYFRVPAGLIRLLFGEAATLVLDGQRAEPKALSEAGFEFRYPELNHALEDLFRDD